MVGDQCVKMICAEGFPSGFAVLGAMREIPGAAQNIRHDVPNLGIVIDYKDRGGDGGEPACGA